MSNKVKNFHPQFVKGLELQFGVETANTLISPTYREKGGRKTAQIQRAGHPHTVAIGELLGFLVPGHAEPLTVGLPWDIATSVAVVTTFQDKVVIGMKIEKIDQGKRCLAPAGTYDDSQDIGLLNTILRESREELGFEIDKKRIFDLGRLMMVHRNDTREADVPTHKTGYWYELTDEEWDRISHIDTASGEIEMGGFELFDESGFTKLCRDGHMLYGDQIHFVQRYFELLTGNKLDSLFRFEEVQDVS